MTISQGDQLQKVRLEPGMMGVSQGKWVPIEGEVQHIFRVRSYTYLADDEKPLIAVILEVVE
jgi:hypothetical protein